MKGGVFLLFFFGSIQGMLGQNLLSNESFEMNTGNIASRELDFNKVYNWDAFTPSPDYIGADPSIFPHWPRPVSGNYYAMIGSSESIGQSLSLSESVTYRIRLKVCSIWDFQNTLQIFGLDEVPGVTNSAANNVHLHSGNLEWESTQIKGDTIWHTIEGCFKARKNIKYLVFIPKGPQMWMAIDDVVIEVNDFANDSKHILPADTILCDQSLGFDLKPLGLDSIISWSDGSQTNQFRVDTTGIYFVTGFQKNCLYMDSIYIQFLESPNVVLPKDTFICDHQYIRIDATTSHHHIVKSNWNTGDSGLYIITRTEGIYWIEVSNACGISRDSILIKAYQKPGLELGDPIENCDSSEIEINAYKPDILQYLWSDGSILAQNSFRYGFLGLTISNFCGSASDTVEIRNEHCECKIHFPNAFTPNHDQMNDTYSLITNCSHVTGTLKVYNRWGEKLFETTDLENGWNGYYRNTSIKGVYMVIFEINTSGSERKIVSKTIHLL